MLDSSKEYLRALREGNYLRFLEWPYVIEQHYRQDNRALNADDVRNLIVYEWVRHGVSGEDIESVAILYAVFMLEPSPLKGGLAWSLTSIVAALYQCMAYISCNVQIQQVETEELSCDEIIELLNTLESGTDLTLFNSMLQKDMQTFLSKSESIEKSKIIDVASHINAITVLRYRAEEYVTLLESIELPKDELQGTRLSLVKKLVEYLGKQTELTDDVQSEIAQYVEKIKEMQPAQVEEDLLNNISPPSLMHKTVGFMVGISARFFSVLKDSFFEQEQPLSLGDFEHVKMP